VGYTALYPLLGAMVLLGKIDAIRYIGLLFFCRAALFYADMVYQNFQAIRLGVVPVQRLFETLGIEPAVAEKPDAYALTELLGRVEFDNVTFSYVEGTPVLRDVSFTLEPGQKLGIVGPSGAGKSTITSLLFRFWDPDKGAVRIDGHDVRDLKMNTVLKRMGVILQFTHLFSGSIADNIRYGNPGATDDEVVAAAKAAGFHDDIISFPKGYETDVGEGEKLSGGQRQRLSIARALVKKPQLLVLDEPTASLDPKTAAWIGETLREISANVTTLIISHRLSDVEDANRILVADSGRIVEEGTHESLLARGGLYADLYRRQLIAGGEKDEGSRGDAQP
jgi:ABC-type multidrug transport system fused ATPase/permease subunit